MPRGDRTGPAGLGPMTGRGGGYCVGSGMPDFNRAGGGGFWGRVWGSESGPGRGGRGFCRWFFGAGLPAWRCFAGRGASFEVPDPATEKRSLEDQAETLQFELDRIKKRIQEMEAGQASG